MDAIDRKLLTLLQEDASLSLAELATHVNLSTTPCWKRIQKLEREGYIIKRVALVSPEKLGLGHTIFVIVETGEFSAENVRRFVSEVSAIPEVMDIYRMAGDGNYMLRMVVPDMETYDVLLSRLTERGALKTVTSYFAMQRIKSTTAYPVTQIPLSR